jgi:hypothetical protein
MPCQGFTNRKISARGEILEDNAEGKDYQPCAGAEEGREGKSHKKRFVPLGHQEKISKFSPGFTE